jgi:hypothetical protein
MSQKYFTTFLRFADSLDLSVAQSTRRAVERSTTVHMRASLAGFASLERSHSGLAPLAIIAILFLAIFFAAFVVLALVHIPIRQELSLDSDGCRV